MYVCMYGNTNLMHLMKHLVHPGKFITKHKKLKSWDKPPKNAKFSE